MSQEGEEKTRIRFADGDEAPSRGMSFDTDELQGVVSTEPMDRPAKAKGESILKKKPPTSDRPEITPTDYTSPTESPPMPDVDICSDFEPDTSSRLGVRKPSVIVIRDIKSAEPPKRQPSWAEEYVRFERRVSQQWRERVREKKKIRRTKKVAAEWRKKTSETIRQKSSEHGPSAGEESDPDDPVKIAQAFRERLARKEAEEKERIERAKEAAAKIGLDEEHALAALKWKDKSVTPTPSPPLTPSTREPSAVEPSTAGPSPAPSTVKGATPAPSSKGPSPAPSKGSPTKTPIPSKGPTPSPKGPTPEPAKTNLLAVMTQKSAIRKFRSPSAQKKQETETKKEEERHAKAIEKGMKGAAKRTLPFVSLMKKDGPPILSLPGGGPPDDDGSGGGGGGGRRGGGGGSGRPTPEPGRRALLDPREAAARIVAACRKNDWITVDTLLKTMYPGDIDTTIVTEANNYSPIHYAAKENRVNILMKLVEMGYNLNAKGKDGFTPLHLACIHAREDTIRILLLNKADPLIPGGIDDQLPIHLICSKPGSAPLISLQLILRSGPKDMRAFTDGNGMTPLVLCIENENIVLARELLAEAAFDQVNVKIPPKNETPAFFALRKRDMDMLKMLVEEGANVNAQNSEGQTLLHITCGEGLESFTKFLHFCKANPDVCDNEEKTPLHIATERGFSKIVAMLTDKFKANLDKRTRDGSTLVHLASAAGDPATAAIFLKKGVPLLMSNKKGAKAIHLAAMTGNLEVIKNVLEKGENVDVKTADGFTPLHLAVQCIKPEAVEILLGYGAKVFVTAGKGETPLHTCARHEQGHKCADLLIKCGAPVNAPDDDGDTPFHVACRSGHLSTLKLLLADQADFTILNKNGENVLHVVAKECHFGIAQRLLKHMLDLSGKDMVIKMINQKNKAGESCIHYVASLTKKKIHYPFEDRDMMRLFVQAGGDALLETGETAETTIHYSSKSGNINVLEEVLGPLQPQDAQTVCNKPAKSGWSPLLYACYHGHPEIIKVLLKQHARVDVFDESGKAALHLAAELGHEDVVQLLLANKAFVNVRNKNGLTPLHLAARKGFNNMVKQLVAAGAAIDALSLVKQTPLHLSAESGQLQVSTTLLGMKADVNALDHMNQTPLHLAAQNDHPQVLLLFLNHKPELVSVPNKNGQTCAHIAAEKGSVAVLKELMKFNVETVKTARIKKTGNTSLHLACEGGHVRVVRQLLQAGAKPGDENAEGYTALHCAARNGHLKVLSALKGSCDWKVCSRKNGLTALHVAAKYGQADFVSEILTEVPAGVKSERSLNDPHGDYGVTPLHLAAQNGHESTVRLLMNCSGVNIDEKTALHESTAMHLTAQGGHLLVAGLIISRSTAALKMIDKNGRTCVHVAAAAGQREMVGLLLGQGAEVNTQDKRLWTPLHYAARYGYLDVVELLVENSADTTSASKDNKIPLGCAASAGHYEVISYLLKKEHDTLALMEDNSFLIDMMNCSKNHDNKPIREFILVSEAPIDTAVKLAKRYETLSEKDKERSRDLEAVSHYCDQVAIDLLTVTATITNPGSLFKGIDHNGTEFLDVLIELERKDVVSQHSVQRYLTEMWMGRLKWPTSAFVGLFLAFIFCPIVWCCVSTPIGHNLGKKPIIKFTSYLTSHIFFIILMVYTTLNIQLPLFEYTSLMPYWFEWLLFTWIVGNFTSEISNPSDKSGLGAIKVAILFIAAIACCVHVGAFIMQIFYYPDIEFEKNEKLYHSLYIRNQLLAFALLLSFVEFLNFLTFHPLFGPWGVIIQDLIKDLLLFMAILAIFLAGFTLQVCAIYQPVYRPPSNLNGSIPEIGSVFQSPGLTFEMLFYALFGLVEPDSMPPMHLNPPFSKFIMKIVFGVFMMVTVIVLINLLIAMMSNTYQRIEAQSDIEWKFGRAKLIRNMNRTLPTPPPINLFAGIPLLIFEKIMKKVEAARAEKEMALAKHAFGHLDSQRSSVVEAKKWLNRRASKVSRTSRVTSAMSNFGAEESSTDELRPIADVVNWPQIVQKYLESIGAVSATGDDEENQGGERAEGETEPPPAEE